MCEIYVKLNTVDEVRDFVRAATIQPYDIFVGGRNEYVSAKSFIGMFALDLRNVLRVTMYCGDEGPKEFVDLIAPLIVEH